MLSDVDVARWMSDVYGAIRENLDHDVGVSVHKAFAIETRSFDMAEVILTGKDGLCMADYLPILPQYIGHAQIAAGYVIGQWRLATKGSDHLNETVQP